jgi:hypothetical protein
MVPGTMIPQPQQPQQQQGMTAEQLLAQLQQQKQQADAAVTAATQKAMVPTSSMAGGTSPGLTMNPVQPYQQQPYNNRQPLSQKQGQGQGIQNILTAAANIVGKYGQKRQQEQQRALSVDLERVFQSVDGIQQAQDALKLDPNNKDAQAAVKKDQGIIDALLSDPKKQKQIAKALDISFTDPSSNAGPEHDALKQAAKSYSQQLMDKIPQGMKPNPAAIQQLQLAQAQQKSANDAIEKIAPTVIREGAANDREQFRQQNENQRKIAEIQANEQKTQEEIAGRFQTAISVAKTNGEQAMARTQYKAQTDYQRTMDALQMREQLISQRGLSGDKLTAATQKNLQLAMKANSDASVNINQQKQLRNQLQKQEKLEGNDPRLQPYNQSIKFWEDQLKTSTDLIDKYQKKLNDAGPSAGADSSDWKKNANGSYTYTGVIPPFRNNNGQSTTKSDTGSNSKVVGQSADSDEDDSDIYGVSDDNTEQ